MSRIPAHVAGGMGRAAILPAIKRHPLQALAAVAMTQIKNPIDKYMLREKPALGMRALQNEHGLVVVSSLERGPCEGSQFDRAGVAGNFVMAWRRFVKLGD